MFMGKAGDPLSFSTYSSISAALNQKPIRKLQDEFRITVKALNFLDDTDFFAQYPWSDWH